MSDPETEPLHIPITSELDLHTFDPKDLPVLLPAYFDECLKIGIHEVRVVHGKGTGTLKRRVEHLLQHDPRVASYALGNENTGSWGATIVQLHPIPKS